MDTRAVVLKSVEDDAMSQRILVVDDDPSITKAMRAYLEQVGYAVLTAADGEQALRLVRQERPELIVLDVMLPNRDGWEITRRIRRRASSNSLAAMRNFAR